MSQEPEVTTMSEKGQVVIPQEFRNYLGIKPKTKFIVFVRGDAIIMKKLQLPDIKKEWDDIFKSIDKKKLNLTEYDIAKEIKAHRKGKHKKARD